MALERHDAARGRMLRDWMTVHVLPEFAARTASIDRPVALRCAVFLGPEHRPDPLSDGDALITTTAAVYGCRVVTRNVANVAATGVPCLGPWSAPSAETSQ